MRARRVAKVTAGVVLVVLAVVMMVVWFTPKSSAASEDAYCNVVTLPKMDDYDDIHDWYNAIETIDSKNKNPFEDDGGNKCIGNIHFSYSDGTSATWDIYIVLWDGIEGTAIVNDHGNYISFYGDLYDHAIENYNVHLNIAGDAGLCVYPEGENLESFMVVTYKD